jgi:hypothetical protein
LVDSGDFLICPGSDSDEIFLRVAAFVEELDGGEGLYAVFSGQVTIAEFRLAVPCHIDFQQHKILIGEFTEF